MKCSFCAIPDIRGPYRSRSIDSIIKEATTYKKLGFQEINLISQNSTYYGTDGGGKSQLPELLKQISKLDFKWIRILYLMPEEVNENPDEIIESFSNPSIVHYFDLPFQHISKNILRKMKRGGGFEKNLKLIEKIRKRFKDAVIRTTFIVGFPGETEKDFDELVTFAEESRIERIGVFEFSKEENTEAFQLKSEVPPELIAERKEILMDISTENIKKYNQSLRQSIQEFLPLAPWDNNTTIGRITCQAPEVDGLTQISNPFKNRHEIHNIKIRDCHNEMLLGEKI